MSTRNGFTCEDIFDALSDYYNHEQYRFEISPGDLDTVQDVLEEHFYEPVIVEPDALATYCVVKKSTRPMLTPSAIQ